MAKHATRPFPLMSAAGRLAVPAALVALMLSTPAMVRAQTAPAAVPLFSQVIAGVEAKGYRVIEAEAKGPVFDIEAIASDGRKVDLRVDAASGEILQEKLDN